MPNKKVVFFFGAGASYADGLPLQKDFIPSLFRHYFGSEYEELINFIRANFFVDTKHNIFPEVESIYSYMNYFIENNESINRNLDYESILSAKRKLDNFIHKLLHLSSKRQSKIYNGFLKYIYEESIDSSIITTNYDTLLDEAFDKFYPEMLAIDYCIPLINYDSSVNVGFNWWVDPSTQEFRQKYINSRPIKYLKIHGSINWRYCNCCNRILLTPWNTDTNPTEDILINYNKPLKSNVIICPTDKNRFQTLIVPPSLNKKLTNRYIQQLMSISSLEISKCDTLIIIGYSLPEADVHIKAMLKRHLGHVKQVIIVNRNKNVFDKFRFIKKKLLFINESAEDIALNHMLLRTRIN